MNATVNVVLFKSKTLADGSHPLMIRICKDNKKKYKSLSISLKPQYWDFEKNQPRRNCPNREYIKSIISEKMIEYSNQILEYKSESKSFTASNLLKKVDGNAVSKTVEELIKSEIGRLESEGRLKYASTYKDLQSSMINFNTHLDIYFSDIDFEWLVRYETWLRKSNLLLNSIGVRFRTLRALYNRAIQLNYVKSEHYPFREYKVSKLKEETVKRSISKIQVDEIINYKTERWYTQFAIDLFYFSYLLAGINFNDIAKLRHDNIIEGRLVYTRSKTKKLIKLPIQDNAMKLILKYTAKDNPYIFPILTAFHKTDLQKLNRIHKALGIINKSLENVGEDLGLPLKLTTYVARHTYATVLKRSGVNTSIISESLGHSSEKVTQIYLDSFENSQIEEAMKNLL